MESNTAKKHWYDSTALVIILTIIFFPVGLYGVYKNQSLKTKTKYAIFAIYAVLAIIGAFSPPPEPGSNAYTSHQSLPQHGEYKGFMITNNEATLTKNMGQVIDIDILVMDIGDHVTEYMKKVMKDDKLNKLHTINLNYEIKNNDNPNYRVATLVIPVSEWQQIPEDLREKTSYVTSNLENWKRVIDYEVVMEIRKVKKDYGY